MHDFSSAQEAYGVPAYQLEAFLRGTPELAVQPFKRPEEALIDVEVAEKLFIGKTPFLTTSEVGRKLQRSDTLVRNDLAALQKAGLLRGAAGARVSPRQAFYSEPEIDALIKRLVESHEMIEAENPKMVSIYDLSFKYGMKNEIFWALVAAGRLTRFRMMKDTGFIDGLRVDLSEVMQVICGRANVMTRAEVCKLLGVDPNIVRILEANSILTNIPADPKFSNKLGHLFDAAEVDAFRMEHMTLPEVRRCFRESPSFQRLKKMGLHPTIHLPPLGKAPGFAIFYRRAEVLQLG